MPTGRGGNLTQPLKKVLINVPGPDNLGVYMDTVSGFRILQFKQAGYSIPWTGAGGFTVQQPQPAVAKLAIVTLSDVAPLDPLNYNYGINIIRRVDKPGVDNSQHTSHQKYYGGTLASITTPTISAAELNEMRDDIITQINADIGYTHRFPYEMPGAAVIASAPIILDTWDALSAMTLDGDAVAAAADIDAFIVNINLLAGFLAIEDPDTAGNINIYKTDTATPGPAVFANTAGTIAQVATNGAIGLLQRYENATFEVAITNTLGTSRTVRETVFPRLTSDEVFQVFSHIPNYGFLAQEVGGQNTPLPDTTYVRINIDIQQDHYDLGGASHLLNFITSVEVYIPAAEWNIAIGGAVNERWEATAANRSMDAGAVNNVRDLIALWST